MGYIYLITNIITKKQYVGQTLCKNVETRWKQHKKCDHNSIGRYLLAAYNKYGIESFKFQIICICFDEDCNLYEEEYIKKFNTLVPNGYNLREGGKNSKQHPETIEKISDKLKGRRLTPLTDDIRIKLSENSKGVNNSNYGKKISKEQKEKQSIKMKKIWEDRKNNNIAINNRTLFKGENKKAVGRYDSNNNLLENYESIVQAGEKIGICYTSIGKVCNGNSKYKRAGGFIWKFLSDQILTS
jgi:group I intron endonuclease